MSQADVSTCSSAPQRVFQEAVKKGNTKELHSLLQNMTNCEFNVNSFGPEGQTALHQSVIDGNLELVKLLVKFGADIRLANRDGWSALHIAAFGGHQDIVLYLITKAKYSSSGRASPNTTAAVCLKLQTQVDVACVETPALRGFLCRLPRPSHSACWRSVRINLGCTDVTFRHVALTPSDVTSLTGSHAPTVQFCRFPPPSRQEIHFFFPFLRFP
ncbi:notch-regulated ankyrin repeat-containing protein A-like [Arapaima gigas]